MSKEKQTMTVEEYRRKHKRCKTCVYARQEISSWICGAKGTLVEGKIGWYPLRGCFCKLYRAKGIMSL